MDIYVIGVFNFWRNFQGTNKKYVNLFPYMTSCQKQHYPFELLKMHTFKQHKVIKAVFTSPIKHGPQARRTELLNMAITSL